jgi:hypothetical protein
MKGRRQIDTSVRQSAIRSRREFLAGVPLALTGLALLGPSRIAARIAHPDPRPGIDGSDVLTAEDLAAFGDEVLEVYDMIREVAHVADGIGCGCGCAALPTYRSLLTCFHAEGMAMGCAICQGEARLVHRRHREGQSLEQIRRAVDARYG